MHDARSVYTSISTSLHDDCGAACDRTSKQNVCPSPTVDALYTRRRICVKCSTRTLDYFSLFARIVAEFSASYAPRRGRGRGGGGGRSSSAVFMAELLCSSSDIRIALPFNASFSIRISGEFEDILVPGIVKVVL